MPHEANPEAQNVPLARLTAGYLRPGLIVDERYKIEAFLGAGGMCSVYKAEHLNLQKPVALKFLRADLATTDAVERFRHETIAVSAMEHPNIVQVYGWGIFQGRPYMAMEFLDGVSLAAMLAREPNVRLPEQKAVPIFVQICEALIHAHAKGIIHRDLKPSNVMLIDNEQTVRLVDFGVAKILPESGKELQKLTQTGNLLGSVPYMSPEQCEGNALDARSDVYSLGCLMYEVITGRTPFATDSPYATLAQHVHAEPQRSELIDTALGNTILLCLKKDPFKRPQSAEELKHALQNPGADPKAIRKRRQRLLVSIATFIVLLGAGLGAAFSYFTSEQYRTKQAASYEVQINAADKRLAEAVSRVMRSKGDAPADGGELDGILNSYRQGLRTAERTSDQASIKEATARLAHALTLTRLFTGVDDPARENEAVALCQTVLSSDSVRTRSSPSSFLAVEVIGDAYMNKHRYAEAKRYVDLFENLCGGDIHPWALLRQAQVYLGCGLWHEAVRKFSATIEEVDAAQRRKSSTLCLERSGEQVMPEAQLGLAKARLGASGGIKGSDEYRQGVDILKRLAQSHSNSNFADRYRQEARKMLEQLHEPL